MLYSTYHDSRHTTLKVPRYELLLAVCYVPLFKNLVYIITLIKDYEPNLYKLGSLNKYHETKCPAQEP